MKNIKCLISELFSMFSEILNIAGSVTLFMFVLIGFIYNWNLKELLIDLSHLQNKDLSLLILFSFALIFFIISSLGYLFRLFKKDHLEYVVMNEQKIDVESYGKEYMYKQAQKCLDAVIQIQDNEKKEKKEKSIQEMKDNAILSKKFNESELNK